MPGKKRGAAEPGYHENTNILTGGQKTKKHGGESKKGFINFARSSGLLIKKNSMQQKQKTRKQNRKEEQNEKTD
jgi:hypothetical protein